MFFRVSQIFHRFVANKATENVGGTDIVGLCCRYALAARRSRLVSAKPDSLVLSLDRKRLYSLREELPKCRIVVSDAR